MIKNKFLPTILILVMIFIFTNSIMAYPKPDVTSYGFYSGDAHLHTNKSLDARGLHPFTDVNDMVTAAKREGLNWIVITEHSELIAGFGLNKALSVFKPEEWQAQQQDIAAVTDFPVISGEEITMGNGNDLETQGHFLGYGLNNLVQTLYDTSDPSLKLAQDSLNEVRNQGAFSYIAHPYKFGALFSSMDAEAWKLWDLVPENEDIIKGIELLHASHEAPTAAINAWDKKLQQGKKFFAVGNSDAHQAGSSSIMYPVVGEAFTYVKTNGALTKDSILEALKSGRSVVSNGPFFDVRINGEGPGETVEAQEGDNLQVFINWESNTEFKKLELFDQTTNTNGQPIPASIVEGDADKYFTYTVKEDGYIRLRAETIDGKAAYSNPIFIQVPGSSQESKIFQQTQDFKVSTAISKPSNGYVLDKNIYKNKIVWWEGTSTKWGGSIYFKDLSTDERNVIATNSARNPDIYGNIVVWEDNRNGNWDIYAKDISTGSELQVATNSADQTNPSIFEKTIVWEDARNKSERPADDYEVGSIEENSSDIYMKDLATGIERPVSLRFGAQSEPVINGKKVVWVGYRFIYGSASEWATFTDADIFMADINTGQEIQITNDPSDQGLVWEPLGHRIYAPAIYGDKILWVDGRNMVEPGINQDIYMKDLSSGIEKQLSTGPNDQTSPAIFGDYAVWTDTNWDDPDGNSVNNLIVVNLTNGDQKKIKLANNNYFASSDIYNNSVVWEEDSNINQASLFDNKLENTFSLSVSQGGASTKQVNIKPGLLQTEFNFTKNENILTTLIQPDGMQISAVSFSNNVTYAKTASSESFKIDNPMPGNWQIKLEPLSVPVEGENIEVDNSVIAETPPTVSFSAPNDKTIARGTVPIAASANDNEEITDFSLALDGESIAASSDNKNISYDWNTTQKSDGYHEVSAIASDVKQSIGQDSHTVVVDNYQPQAVIEKANWITNFLLIDFDASKSVDVAEFNYNWDFGDGTLQNESNALTDHLYASPGIYNVGLTVKDAAGNSSNVTKQLTIDTAAPSASILINNNDSYTSSTSVNLLLQATDDLSGVYQMRFSNDGEIYSDWEEYSQTKLWNLTDNFGEKIVYARFSDKAGNITTTTDSIFLIPLNLIQNSSFEVDADNNGMPDNWAPIAADPGDGRSSDSAIEGSYSDKINGDPAKGKYIYQHLNITGNASDDFIFFGMNKTNGPSANGGFIGAILYLNHADSSKTPYYLFFDKNTHNWVARSKLVSAYQDFVSADVVISYSNQTGTAYFDDFKLYSTDNLSTIATNGSFEMDMLNWNPLNFDPTDGVTNTTASEGIKSLMINGDTAKNKLAHQHINITGSASQDFVLFGMNRTDGASATGGFIGAVLYLNHADNTKTPYYIFFDKNTHGWVARSKLVSAYQDFVSADVVISYSNQTGTGYFDDFKLLK